MFDKYLEAPDDGEFSSLRLSFEFPLSGMPGLISFWAVLSTGIAPRHNPAPVVNRFLDLAATEEDHNDVSSPQPAPSTFSSTICIFFAAFH